MMPIFSGEQHILKCALKECNDFILILSDGNYLAVWPSDNEAFTDGCDSVVGYALYGPDKKEIDSGELDFNSNTQYQNGLIDAVDNILDDMYFKQTKPVWYRMSSLDRFEDEFE